MNSGKKIVAPLNLRKKKTVFTTKMKGLQFATTATF